MVLVQLLHTGFLLRDVAYWSRYLCLPGDAPGCWTEGFGINERDFYIFRITYVWDCT